MVRHLAIEGKLKEKINNEIPKNDLINKDVL